MSLKKWIVGIGVNWAYAAIRENVRTNQVVKDVVHVGNELLRQNVVITGKGEKGVQYGKDLIALGQLYLNAFGDEKTPGLVDENELVLINADCDRIIDKYVPNERFSSWVDTAFGWVRKLVDRVFK